MDDGKREKAGSFPFPSLPTRFHFSLSPASTRRKEASVFGWERYYKAIFEWLKFISGYIALRSRDKYSFLLSYSSQPRYQVWTRNRPFPGSKNSHFQNEAKSKTFLLIFFAPEKTIHFHIKGFEKEAWGHLKMTYLWRWLNDTMELVWKVLEKLINSSSRFLSSLHVTPLQKFRERFFIIYND